MKYLGAVFSNNGSLKEAAKDLADKARRALFKLYKSFGNYTPSIKTLLHLFDATIQPILLYGSEVWGTNVIDMEKSLQLNVGKTGLYFKHEFEKVHIQCCKYILGVNRKCSNLAAIAEIGRYPKLIQIVINILKYWIRIRNMDEESLVYKSFVENIKLLNNGHYCWLKTIQDIFNTLDICKKDNTAIFDPENIPYLTKGIHGNM